MFQVGDYIVYPMQGAGVVEAIEEKEVLGEKRNYYVIRIPSTKMRVMIPVGKEKKARIRLVSDSPTLEKVLNIIQHGQTDSTLSMKERYKINSEKLRTGNFKDGAEVVRDLMRINSNKALNQSEKQMLETARKFFISELGLIKGISENQAMDWLKDKVV
ncbi:CarD family transcriptional regulator [Neobacillus kokaensis]|uniref:CarD family transcriptional regulator n=1 Tax=Neobacillus kokaensis TaxID=2759023 RepID=A0ABQ3MW14_9BACI|nr:CarD family transcriptional regulator [Neobacillus kokaensis]GHH96863.1 CarD family transcriptional regulator [Neobacillus kokaensis]